MPDAVVRYASHDDGLVDVHLLPPPRPPHAPLVVLLHGGFWKQVYDRRHTRPLAGALAAEGHVVATPTCLPRSPAAGATRRDETLAS